MNCIAQSKRIKSNAKWCYWCKYFEFCCDKGFPNTKLKHRQALKSIRENDFRYCKIYKFSKENFKEWKSDYLGLQEFYDEKIGRMEE
jgi:hypothetical protein